MGKGIYGITLEMTDLPKNYLSNLNEEIKLKGKIKRDLISIAFTEYNKVFKDQPDMARRALEGFGIKLIEEQDNKEQVAMKLFSHLNNKNIEKKEPVHSMSNDWLTSFWKLAELKSEEDIREIFAKILADEIVKPRSFSLHTLQTLSVLSSDIGLSFNKICNLSFDDGRMAYFLHPNVFAFQNIGLLDEFGISLEDLLDLDGAGLIRSVEALQINYTDGQFESVDYAGQKAKINFSDQQVYIIFFTKAGRELRKLMTLAPNDNYTHKIKLFFKENFIME